MEESEFSTQDYTLWSGGLGSNNNNTSSNTGLTPGETALLKPPAKHIITHPQQKLQLCWKDTIRPFSLGDFLSLLFLSAGLGSCTNPDDNESTDALLNATQAVAGSVPDLPMDRQDEDTGPKWSATFFHLPVWATVKCNTQFECSFAFVLVVGHQLHWRASNEDKPHRSAIVSRLVSV